MRKINLMDHRFGRLLVIKELAARNRKSYWQCRCDCGKIVDISMGNLRYGLTKSCGCLSSDMASKRRKKHGHTIRGNTPEYQSWCQIKTRCYNKKSKDYKNYGGRGITICKKWKNDFQSFLSHVGFRPSPNYTIGRIDNDKSYVPSNVRWENRIDQGNNKRNNIILEYAGKKMTLSHWARETGLHYKCLHKRIQVFKWPVEKALTTPSNK